jgi:ubiquinone/menaquinone biosynthesis C-methylase UbiE
MTEGPCLSDETHWEKAARTRMGKYLTKVETDFIKTSVDLSCTRMIMDVGAEAGRFSQLSADDRTNVVSIDIDSYGLKRLRQKMKRVDVVQADARSIPFKDGTFDAIFMIEVLDYIPQLDTVLSECNRTLRQGTPLILSFGNKSSLKARLRKIGGKSYQHSYKQVVLSLQGSGLATIRKTGYNWLPFGRMSENPLIPTLGWAERAFGFGRVPSLSPWVLIRAEKT